MQKKAAVAHAEILDIYGITADRSVDLVSSDNKIKTAHHQVLKENQRNISSEMPLNK